LKVATLPLQGAPAVTLKLTAAAVNGAGLTVRLVCVALAPKPVVPAPSGVPL
jgi:hypothetical protein